MSTLKEEKKIEPTERFISVDSGKFRTKVALLSNDMKSVLKFGFRTMVDNGSFEDDAIESTTFIAQIDGKVYKIGNGASREAFLETTKKSEIHKVTTLAAIALTVNDGDIVNVCIGCPIKEYEVVEKRNQYRDYILPEGEVSIMLKTKNETEPKMKTFTIAYRVVYPELAGVLYLDIEKFSKKTVGVIDIGGGTGLGCIFDNFEVMSNTSFSSELGGNVLATGLTQTLSAEFSRCNVDYVRKLLLLSPEKRKLVPTNGTKEFIEDIGVRSKNVIDDYLMNHTRELKRQCDAKHWSLEYMNLVFVGGTASRVLQNEIREVFGQNVIFAENSEYANAIGFLRRMCGKKLKISIDTTAKEQTAAIMQGSNGPVE